MDRARQRNMDARERRDRSHRQQPRDRVIMALGPTQKQIKAILETEPTIDAPSLAGMIKLRSEAFKTFYLGGVQTATSMTLSEALDLYEDFHILEALPQRWSAHQLFKCNCTMCFKNASCAHVLLASMLCDKQIEVPMQYVDASLQYRRRRPGRPTAKGTGRSREEKALAELKSRERSGLDSQRHEYRVPTVSGMFARILSRL